MMHQTQSPDAFYRNVARRFFAEADKHEDDSIIHNTACNFGRAMMEVVEGTATVGDERVRTAVIYAKLWRLV